MYQGMLKVTCNEEWVQCRGVVGVGHNRFWLLPPPKQPKRQYPYGFRKFNKYRRTNHSLDVTLDLVSNDLSIKVSN